MFKLIKKRKANKIQKLKTRVIELEEENNDLRRRVFQYKLKDGEIKPTPRRRMMKVMGKMGEGALDD